jgi:hypothetical protein
MLLSARAVESQSRSAVILIVSRNAATAQRLRAYFEHFGAIATTIDHLKVAAWVRDDVRAVVVFPDEFPHSLAAEALRKIARRFTQSWMVIVTRDTARFEGVVADAGSAHRGRLFVLPRPVWGWALLDRVLKPPPSGRHDTHGTGDGAEGE